MVVQMSYSSVCPYVSTVGGCKFWLTTDAKGRD